MAETHCRFEHLPAVFFRIQLLWTRQFPSPYNKLSFNIAREVCSYYRFLPDVLIRESRSVWAFKIVTKTWELLKTHRVFIGSVITSVFIGEEKVFMVMREQTSAYEDPPYYSILDHGNVRRYAFQHNRYACAVAYDQVIDCVYILGGRTFLSLVKEETKRCEKLPISTGKLQQMTDMLEGRYGFGLCWHHALLYLCAGSHPSVHTFDPITQVHTALSYLASDIETDTAYLAVSYKNEVVMLSRKYMWKGQGQEWRKTARASEDSFTRISQPVLFNSCLYYSDLNACVALNLDTQALVRYTHSFY